MRLKIRCTCKKVLIVPEELMGKRVKCPACGEKLTIASVQALRDSGVFKAIPKSETAQAAPATPPPSAASPAPASAATPRPAAKPASGAPKAAKPTPKPAVTPPPQKAAPAAKPATPRPAAETLSLEDLTPSATPPRAEPEPPTDAPAAPAKIKPVEPAKVAPPEPAKAASPTAQEEAIFSFVDESPGQPPTSIEGVLVDESAATTAAPPVQPTEPPKSAEVPEETGACPNCKEPVEKGAVLCVKCGTNLKTGEKVGGAKAAEEPKAKKGWLGWLKRGKKTEAAKSEEPKAEDGAEAEETKAEEGAEAKSEPAAPAKTPPPAAQAAGKSVVRLKPVATAKVASAPPPKAAAAPTPAEESLVLEDARPSEPSPAASILAEDSESDKGKAEDAAAEDTMACPYCKEQIGKGSVICVKCGTNLKTGEKLGGVKAEPPKAKKGLFGWLKRGRKEEPAKADESKAEEAEGEASEPTKPSEAAAPGPAAPARPKVATAQPPPPKKPAEAPKPALRKPLAPQAGGKAPLGKKPPEKTPVPGAGPKLKVKTEAAPKPVAATKEMISCPYCKEQIEKGSVICTQCGTNLKTGEKIGTAAAADASKAKGGMMSWLKKGKGK